MCVESFIYEDSDKYLTLKGFLNQEGKKIKFWRTELYKNHVAEFLATKNYNLIRLIRLG